MSPPRQGEAFAPQQLGPWDAAAVAAYAAASADDNPLHRDPALARAAGLPRPPIHGMLLVGGFERLLASWCPGSAATKLAVKFIRPVLVGEAVEVTGRVVRAGTAAEASVVRLTVKRGGDLVCLAEAFLRFAHP